MISYVRRTLMLLLLLLFMLSMPCMVLAEDIVILHTNDIHCGVLDNVGFPRLAQYKNDLKKAGYKVLLVDAVNCVQGAPIGKLSQGESVVRIMNAVKYDFLIPGNHEFDYGQDILAQRIKEAKYPYVSATVFVEATGKTLVPPSVLLNRKSGKIGIIGMTTPETQVSTTPKNVYGLKFVENEEFSSVNIILD